MNDLKAQQEPQFTQFWNAKNYFNPATSGLNYRHQAILLGRIQWVNIEGNPETQLATYSAKIDKLHGGIGASYMHDKIGFSNEHRAKINYSYQLKLKNESTLSFGTALGLNVYQLKGYWIHPTFAADSSFIKDFTLTKIAADIGIAYSSRKFNSGISATLLTGNFSSENYIYSPCYFLFADYTFGKEDGFQFIPQFFFKTNNNFMQLDLNALVKYKSIYYLGFTFRNRDAFGFIGGVDIKKTYRISYSYDLIFSKLNNAAFGGTHEIVLGFLLK